MNERANGAPAPQTYPSRERVRRFRARKRAGHVVVTIVVKPPLIADLVDLGLLSAEKREDRDAVAMAFVAFAESAWDCSRQAPSLFKAPPR